ncbi:adenylate/guanylate cyclase domain-containing protein [Maribacter aestuarii]|uniref:adenylate/guanylate cyclase domain-containing protein n=1 Tax=Maribacter aestuarii TaxID=1130723 RepID=UPI0025A61D54|nr:adenylate/guanylate cyclase domain-containing protein [Maribacter aestuarii]
MLKYKIIILIVAFQFSWIATTLAQNQAKADSLLRLYHSSGKPSDDFEMVKNILKYEARPDTILYYADLLLSKANTDSDKKYQLTAYIQRGNAYQRKGDYIESLDAFFKAMEVAKAIDDQKSSTSILISIADTYAEIGNTEYAEKYYNEGIESLRQSNDSMALGRVLINRGEVLFESDNYKKALQNYQEAGDIFARIDFPIGMAYKLGNEGMVYAAQGDDEAALSNINEAIGILEDNKDYYAIAIYLKTMADIYAKKQNFTEALKYAQRSLQLASAYGLKEQLADANLKISELYDAQGKRAEAFDFYKTSIIYRDSIKNLETVEQLANLSTAYEVSQKQGEIDILNEKQKNQKIVVLASVAMILLIGMLTFVLYRRNRFIRKTNLIIEREKNRSDHLLKNILPVETAKELKDYGKVKAKKFNAVSVLFADFKGFTMHAEHLSPEELVKSIDFYFSEFDDIIEKYGIEKIKTLGDCYMCACGLPFPAEKHAQKLILAAKDFLDFVASAKKNNPDNTTRFELRVGISSGTVVAGVVGKKKFAYDIWGDTVNIAARMETASEVDKINISEDTFHLVKSDFNCTYRGEIHVKNKGLMKMYFVNGLKSEKEAEFQNHMRKKITLSSEAV